MTIVQLNMFECKRCSSCGSVKCFTEFSKRSSSSDKLSSMCRLCSAQYCRKHYAENRDAVLEKLRTEYAQNPQRRQYNQEYRKNNPDKIRKYKQTDAVRHPEALKRNRAAVAHRRRVRIYSGIGKYTPDQWKQLCDWFGNVCLCCKATKKLSVDHVIPLVKGGRNDIANLQCLCLTCNKKKNTRTTDYRDPDILRAFLEHIQCSPQETIIRSQQ